MNQPSPSNQGVIPRGQVRIVPQPALVECASVPGKGPITVVPLLDGDRVAGFEIRCGCGASAMVECVYDTEAKS